MNDAGINRILTLIEGYWSGLSEPKAAAYADWLKRSGNSATDVEAVVRKLSEENDRLPTISVLVGELRKAGTFKGPRDPVDSWKPWLEGDNDHPGAIRSLMTIHNYGRDNALRELLAQARDDQREFAGLSKESDESYQHRIAAIEKAMAAK